MNDVWMISEDVPYEGSQLLGIFSTYESSLEKWKEIREKLIREYKERKYDGLIKKIRKNKRRKRFSYNVGKYRT